MPVIYKRIQHGGTQFGYNNDGENFKTDANAPSIGNGSRLVIFRFSHVEIPKGSTINSATLHVAYSAKNNGDVATLSHYVNYDSQTPSQWLDTSRPEYKTGSGVTSRTWVLPAGSGNEINFTQSEANPRTIVATNVKPHLDALIANANWTLAGGSVTFGIAYANMSSSDFIYASGPADNWGPLLEVDFTPPASDGKATVVNIQENSIFTRTLNAAGNFDIAPHGFTDYFGGYTQPSVSVASGLNAEVTAAPPSGGNMLRLAAGSGRPMYHFGVPRVEEGKWYNYSCWTWIPTSSPSGMAVAMNLLGDSFSSPVRAEKGQWVRHDKAFMMDDAGVWGCIQGEGTATWDSTCVVYIAGVQLTEGKMLRPWIGGNKTLTGADYGWAGIVGTNGFVRAVPPTITLLTQADKARRKPFGLHWTYAQTNGHVQDGTTIKIRKVR